MPCREFGGTEVLRLVECPTPVPKADEVLVKITAAGVNRADLMQRQGRYPPPPGVTDILGMEISGVVTEVGAGVSRWKIDDRICALISGGGYAEYVAVPSALCLPVPSELSLASAAALPEAMVTVYANLFETGALKKGETALVHGGSSGIGTMAIRLAKLRGARIFVTAGSEEKCKACQDLGADLAVNYRSDDYVEAVLAATDGRGVDVVLDMVGGDYLHRNLLALAPFGRHVSIATQQGSQAKLDLRLIMLKRLLVTGSTLRARPLEEKARLVAAVEVQLWPFVLSGELKALIYQSFPIKNASEAHKMMESGAHIGKIILEVA